MYAPHLCMYQQAVLKYPYLDSLWSRRSDCKTKHPWPSTLGVPFRSVSLNLLHIIQHSVRWLSRLVAVFGIRNNRSMGVLGGKYIFHIHYLSLAGNYSNICRSCSRVLPGFHARQAQTREHPDLYLETRLLPLRRRSNGGSKQSAQRDYSDCLLGWIRVK